LATQPSLMPPDHDALRSIPLLDGVPAPIARAVLDAARVREFGAGATLFSEGQPATAFFVLQTGSVKLVQLTDAGEAVVFRLLTFGDAFGTISVLGAQTYPVSACAVTAVLTLQWEAGTMRSLLEQHPRLSLNVLKSVSDRLQSLRLQYSQLATEKVERRIARALQTLVHRAGTSVGDGVLIDLPLSREDLAQLTGTTMYTVSRIVKRWEVAGILRAGRQQILVRQPHTLASIAADAPSQ